MPADPLDNQNDADSRSENDKSSQSYSEPSFENANLLNEAVKNRGANFIDAANMIAEHWPFASSGANSQRKSLIEQIGKVKGAWGQLGNQGKNKDDLAILEKTLIQVLLGHTQNDKKYFSQMKNMLDNAENHLNWKRRNPESHLHSGAISLDRSENPIQWMTNEQEKEWQNILVDDSEPAWFAPLHNWEKIYLKKVIKEWNKANEETQINGQKINLGEFLGPLPTTIRRYPGSVNAYRTDMVVKKDDVEINFRKYRSGVLAPTKVKDREAQLNITQENLKQMILQSLRDKLSEENLSGDVNVPVLLQTLYSPPFQPSGLLAFDNAAMMQAVKSVRDEFGDPSQLKEFLSLNGVTVPDNLNLKIDLMYANRPVNRVRGLAWLFSFFTGQRKENNETTSKLKEYLDKAFEQFRDGSAAMKPEERDARENQLKFAANAFAAYQARSSIWNSILALIWPRPYNAMAEKAALEQLVVSAIGIRIGSCVSGKDREEMVTQMTGAMAQCYLEKKNFPSGKNDEIRQYYRDRVVEQFHSNYGQKLAGKNAIGCNGLKNALDVYAKEISEAIGMDKIKLTSKIARLNKLSLKKIKKVSIKKFLTKVKEAQSEPFSDRSDSESSILNRKVEEPRALSEASDLSNVSSMDQGSSSQSEDTDFDSSAEENRPEPRRNSISWLRGSAPSRGGDSTLSDNPSPANRPKNNN